MMTSDAALSAQSVHELFTDDLLAEKAAVSELYPRYLQLLENQPELRRRDQAEQLQVSEAALLDQQCGIRSVRLQPQFKQIIEQLPQLGYIMTLTRNDQAVHERKGVYDNVRITGPMGLVITEDRAIDLRIMVNRWVFGFAVMEDTPRGERFSLQFFDARGTAIQKIFLQSSDDVDKCSDAQAYLQLVKRFRADDQHGALKFTTQVELPVYVDSSEVDADAVRKEWSEMTDVHQLFGMLRRYKISREQAFEMIGKRWAQPFNPAQLERVLNEAADSGLSIMCFVGNYGQIQIHTGPVHTIKRMGPWLNVLDAEFNLHLMDGDIASAWLVRKPTDDGDVTSLELYNAAGDTIAQFFGQRNEGTPENPFWRTLAESVLSAEVAA